MLGLASCVTSMDDSLDNMVVGKVLTGLVLVNMALLVTGKVLTGVVLAGSTLSCAARWPSCNPRRDHWLLLHPSLCVGCYVHSSCSDSVTRVDEIIASSLSIFSFISSTYVRLIVRLHLWLTIAAASSMEALPVPMEGTSIKDLSYIKFTGTAAMCTGYSCIFWFITMSSRASSFDIYDSQATLIVIAPTDDFPYVYSHENLLSSFKAHMETYVPVTIQDKNTLKYLNIYILQTD